MIWRSTNLPSPQSSLISTDFNPITISSYIDEIRAYVAGFRNAGLSGGPIDGVSNPVPAKL